MTHYISFTVAAVLDNDELYWREMQLPFEEHSTVQALDSIYSMFIEGFITVDDMCELQQRVFHVSVTADIRRV